MSASSDETEELVRSFPPPHLQTCCPGPPPPTYLPSGTSVPSPSWPIYPPPIFVSSRSDSGSISIQSTSDCALHQFDGHNSSAEQNTRRTRAKKEPEPEVEVIFRHYCARCGRTRSKTFHREHPVKPGKEPYPGICSRCIPPGGFVSEVPSSKRKEIEETTEEVLIRRRCGNRVSGLFKPRYVDVIRISRKSEGKDEAPGQRGKCEPSERIIAVKTHCSYEKLREPAKDSGSYDLRGFRVRVRSSSRDRCDEDDEESLPPRRTQVHQEACSFEPRDRVIGHVRVVTVIHPQPQQPAETKKPAELREPAEPSRPRRPQRSLSPPQWYYRRVRRVTTSDGPRTDDKPEIFTDRTGYFEPEPLNRPDRIPDGPERGPRATCQPEHRSSLDKHNSVRGVLQHSRNDRLNRAHDLYGAEAQRYRRSCPRGDSSSDDEAVRKRRVRFVPPARSNGREAQRRKNDQEEVKDWQEEQRDKTEYKHAKKQVRKGVNEGGGKYELYDVDGHYSEDMGMSDAIQRSQDIAGVSVQSYRDQIEKCDVISGMEHVSAIVQVIEPLRLDDEKVKSESLSSFRSSSGSIELKMHELFEQVSQNDARQPRDTAMDRLSWIWGWILSTSKTAKKTSMQANLPASYGATRCNGESRDSRDAGLD